VEGVEEGAGPPHAGSKPGDAFLSAAAARGRRETTRERARRHRISTELAHHDDANAASIPLPGREMERVRE
jgi:hypothetical protein